MPAAASGVAHVRLHVGHVGGVREDLLGLRDGQRIDVGEEDLGLGHARVEVPLGGQARPEIEHPGAPLPGPAAAQVAEERAVLPRPARIRGHERDHGLRRAPVGLVVVAAAEHVVVDAADVGRRDVDGHAAMEDVR